MLKVPVPLADRTCEVNGLSSGRFGSVGGRGYGVVGVGCGTDADARVDCGTDADVEAEGRPKEEGSDACLDGFRI